jgi:rubredoxin
MIVIKAAEEIRKAKGLPEEKNITILLNEGAPLLGVFLRQMTSTETSKLPAPHETVDEKTGKLVIPRRDCPQCGKKEVMTLHSLCKSCTDSEGGIYKTMWMCPECGFKDKYDRYMAVWLEELGIDFRSGTKQSMGITTITDEGLK